jgi:hypothetical protein
MYVKINKTEVAVMELIAAVVIVLVISWLIYRR